MPFEKLTIEEFDKLARAKAFSDGPYISRFGDGEYEPYCPHKRVFGTLKDGRQVESVKEAK